MSDCNVPASCLSSKSISGKPTPTPERDAVTSFNFHLALPIKTNPQEGYRYRRSVENAEVPLNRVNVVPLVRHRHHYDSADLGSAMDGDVTTLIWNVQQLQLARVRICGCSLDVTLTSISVLQGYSAVQLACSIRLTYKI